MKTEPPTSDFRLPTSFFSTSPFPTIEYISLLLKSENIVLEQYENFQKQSNRSRFHILSPNGIQSLQIPLVHDELQHCVITDVKISYRSHWQRQHWRSIQTAYNRSPFFEFYKDELETLFFKEEKLLFNYNLNLLNWVLKVLKQPAVKNFTNEFVPSGLPFDKLRARSTELNDFKSLSNSKSTDIIFPDYFSPKKYNQVFEYKFGFVANLSVMDLVFNCGNNAVDYLSTFAIKYKNSLSGEF